VAKELEAAQTDLEKLARKLSNEGFLAKASADIIEKDRARAAELTDSAARLTAQLAELAD
jgi:valyl-tRNA synthetase